MCEYNKDIITLTDRLVCDLKCLTDGTFYPLTNFMSEKQYVNVVNHMKLPNGNYWPIPIVLPLKIDIEIISSDIIYLKDNYNIKLASLTNIETFKPNLETECLNVYGTLDTNHPYVKLIKSWGENVIYITGHLTLLFDLEFHPLFINFREFRKTPFQTKEYFSKHDWTTIVGFQTRNPMHKCHIELTKICMNKIGNCNLLIQPIVGITQTKDINYSIRVKCYKHILKEYPPNKVLLSLLPLSMRMAGPKEAVWHALIRKNYGCTHFIIGRDHAGPSVLDSNGNKFYESYEAQQLTQQINLGIEIITSPMIIYDDYTKTYITEDNINTKTIPKYISGTELRNKLSQNKPIPLWFSTKNVINELKRKRGLCIYIIGLPASGKSTLANYLYFLFQEFTYKPISILDGDIIRTHLSSELGFSKKDRSLNVRRIGYVAYEIVKHGGIAICANIAPYQDDRDFNRTLISDVGTYFEIYMDIPIKICESRDLKNLYNKAKQGIITNLTGINDPFEEPNKSEWVVSDFTQPSYIIATNIINYINSNII